MATNRQNPTGIPNNYTATVAPTADEDVNDGYLVGSHWYDITADKIYICIDNTAATAVWTEMNNVSASDIIILDTADYYNSGDVEGALAETGLTLYTSKEPSGFPNRTDSTISWDDASYTLTLTGVDYNYWYRGKKYTKSTDTVQVTNATNLYWIYIDPADNDLKANTTLPGFEYPLVATVYWNAATVKGLVGEERHGMTMDTDTHALLHYTVGTRYESGLTGTFVDITFVITAGKIDDEDLVHSIAQQTTCNVLYKDGSADFKWLAGQTKYYYEDGGSNINYNNGNVLTALAGNQYVAYWIFATNDQTTPIVSLMGQRTDTNIANARANNKYESLELGTLPFQEMKLLYRVILRNDATPYVETLDLRSVSNLPAGTYIASDHGVLTGLADDDHPQYLLTDGTRGLKTIVSTNNTANPPTIGELNTAFGTAAVVGAGYIAMLDDNGAGNNVYICASDGTNWWQTPMVKALA